VGTLEWEINGKFSVRERPRLAFVGESQWLGLGSRRFFRGKFHLNFTFASLEPEKLINGINFTLNLQ
jgi:hypothetical protein